MNPEKFDATSMDDTYNVEEKMTMQEIETAVNSGKLDEREIDSLKTEILRRDQTEAFKEEIKSMTVEEIESAINSDKLEEDAVAALKNELMERK